jgi:hypothetical protein
MEDISDNQRVVAAFVPMGRERSNSANSSW